MQKKIKHLARNIMIAFFVIVLVLTSSSLWLNHRRDTSADGTDGVEDTVQGISNSETPSTASPSVSDGSTGTGSEMPAGEQSHDVWQNEPNVTIEKQDGMTGAVENQARQGIAPDSVAYHDTDNSAVASSNQVSMAEVGSNQNMMQDQAQASAPQDTSASTSYLQPVKSADALAVEVGKYSGNRLIIGADNLPDNLLMTDSAAGYDGVWLAAYDNEDAMRADYVTLQNHGYSVIPDLSVQVCDTQPVHRSLWSKIISAVCRFWRSILYAEDEKPLSEQADGLQTDRQTVVLLDTGDNHADASVNLTNGSSADNNGHGTEMDSIIRANADAPVNIVSIKTVDDDGKGKLSDLLMGIMLAKTVSPSAINISLSSANKETADVVNHLIAKVASDDTAVVAAAGNQNSDASNYVPGNAGSSLTIGAADADGNLQGDSNYGAKVNYYISAPSTSKAAAQFTGLYVSASNALTEEEAQEKNENNQGTVTDSDQQTPSASPDASERPVQTSSASVSESEPDSAEADQTEAEKDDEPASNMSKEDDSLTSAAPDAISSAMPTVVPDGENADTEIASDAETAEPDSDVSVTEVIKQPVAKVLSRMAAMNLRSTAKAPSASGSNGTRPTGYIESLDDDDEYIEMFKILEQQDGTPVDHGNGKMWDDDDEPGNDSGPNNNVVMTYDTINYTLQLTSAPYTDGAYYRHGYIRFRMVLPASETEASFVTGDMGWMVSGTGTDYDWKMAKETIDGKECQVLYCSMYLSAEAAGTPNVFPCIKQTANVSIEVCNMKNGDYLQPKFFCWMDHNETSGVCATHGRNEVMEADSGNIMVSAKPSYNLVITSAGHNPTMTIDFSRGNSTAPNKDLGKRHGTNFVFGTMMELRNDGTCPNKMLKGVEAPTGDINYAIDTSLYFIKADGSAVDITNDSDVQAVMYCVEPNWSNETGREEPTSPYGIQAWPRGYGTGPNTTVWSHTDYQYINNVLTMNLAKYTVDSHRFPVSSNVYTENMSSFYNYDDYGKGARYTKTGVFSTYQFDISLLYETQTLLNKYGAGSVGIKCKLKSISTTSLSGNTARSNVFTNDDYASNAADVHPAGSYTHMMTYEDYEHGWTWNVQGVGPQHYNLADSVGVVGQKFRIGSLNACYDVESDFKLGDDRLVKFNAVAFTPLERNRSDAVFAAKKDGTDWIDDNEKSFAKIEDLV